MGSVPDLRPNFPVKTLLIPDDGFQLGTAVFADRPDVVDQLLLIVVRQVESDEQGGQQCKQSPCA